MQRKKRSWVDIVMYCIFAIFYLWLAAQIPYTHDDWDWGIDNGLYQLFSANINSRYVGNFFVVIMTRSKILKTIIMGMGNFLVPFLMAWVATRNININKQLYTRLFFLIGNFLLLTMDISVWQQTYGWISGYANYVLSAVFMIINLSQLLGVFAPQIKTENPPLLSDVIFGISSLLGQLFIENLAAYMVILSLWTCLIYYIRQKRISRRILMMTIGTIAGLVIMFSSNMYSVLFRTGTALNGARQLSLNAEAGLLENVFNCAIQFVRLIKRGAEEHPVLGCSVLLLMTFLLVRKGYYKSKQKTVLYSAINIALAIYFVLVNALNIEYTKLGLGITLVGALINIAYFFFVSVEIIFLFSENKLYTCKLLTIWLSVVVMLAPLAVTTESGSRLYYVTNCLVIIFMLSLTYDASKEITEQSCRNSLVILTSALLVISLFYGNIYWQIGNCKRQREEIIKEAVAADQEMIVLPKYPHEEYMWSPDPLSDVRMLYFKKFYNIPDSTVVIFQ